MTNRSRAQDQRLRFWNQVVYSALAPAYDSLDWLTLGTWWRLVRRALEVVPPGQQVLEIGFGPGKLQVELARQAAFCTGLDLAQGMCRFTQRRLVRANLPVRIVRGSVYELPYPTDAFECVVSTFAFSGFPEGARALAEMARVTQPGGRVVLVDIGLPQDGNRLGTGLARLWEQMGDFLYDLPTLMTQANLRVTTYEEYGPSRHIRLVVGEKTGEQNFL